MEVTENAEPHVNRTLNGTPVRFGKLTPRDRAGILGRLKGRRKEQLLSNLRAAGIGPEQTLVELEEFDDRPWGQIRWIDYLNTIEGQEEAVRIAFAKHNAGDASPTLDAVELVDGSLLPLAAAALCNLRLAPVEPAAPVELPGEAGAGDDGHPTPPQPAD